MIKKRMKGFIEFLDKKINIQKLRTLNDIKSFAFSNLNKNQNKLIIENNENENEEKNINSITSIYLMNKIHLNLRNILRIFNNSAIFLKQKYLNKWKYIISSEKEKENLNDEIEKKISSKYELKLKEYEKKIKTYEFEFNELKLNLEAFENKQKKLNEQVSNLQEKEKEYIFKTKNIMEERKINLEKLKDLKADLSQKCSKIENYIRELDNVLLTEKDNIKDKEAFVNTYVNEMNALLDYYEKKSGNKI
jgi:hypothetical protein